WRVDSGARLRVLHHPDGVVSASFSPDSRFVVTADGATARIWDSGSGTLLQVLRDYHGKLIGAWFSPNGRLVLTASKDGTARIWDPRTGALIHKLKGHRGPLTSAAFSADGRLVVTAGTDHDGR